MLRGASLRWSVVLSVLACLVSVGVVLAAAPGTWSLTGSLHEARSRHLAVLLTTGKVLVAGGFTPSRVSSTVAELYDPVTGTWSLTGSPNTTHDGGTATLLADGRVLLVGGATAAAELYNPTSGTWSLTGSLHQARQFQTATLLPNGRVLVAGGTLSTGAGGVTASAELYDPATGTWSTTASMSTARFGHSATLLLNGKVLVAGGDTAFGGPITAKAELYDPASGTWTPTGSLKTARLDHTATLLVSGKVLVAAGDGPPGTGVANTGIQFSAELYDPASGTWSFTGNLINGRDNHTATLLADGTVLVAGGETELPGPTPGTFLPIAPIAQAELYNPTSGTWSSTGSLNVAREAHTATLLPDLTVLAAGGATPSSGGPVPTASAERYTPAITNVVPSSCALTGIGADPAGRVSIQLTARNLTSGLKAVQTVQTINVSVRLPSFLPGSRDPVVTTATQLNPTLPSSLTLAVTSVAGDTRTCGAAMADLMRQRGFPNKTVFADLPQAESTLTLVNGTPGLREVRLEVNGHRFRLEHLQNGETRTLSLAAAMRPGDRNTVVVRDEGRRGISAVLVLSD